MTKKIEFTERAREQIKNNGIIIKANGIKNLKFSSNVKELVIQNIPLKKKTKTKYSSKDQ